MPTVPTVPVAPTLVVVATVRCDFFSQALGHGTSITVLLPDQPSKDRSDEGSPVLYLLHGLGDDSTAALRMTSIARYVEDLDLTVVMPQTDRSFAVDEAYGGAYWTFLSQELPEVVQRHFRASGRREDTFAVGISMGGYGAVKLGLLQPERFAAVASLSGAVDLVGVIPRRAEREKDWQRIFGGRDVAGTDDDLLALLERGQDPESLPAIYVCCGVQEELHGDNMRFVETAIRHDVQVTTDFGDGAHTFAYWDAQLPKVLAWLPLSS